MEVEPAWLIAAQLLPLLTIGFVSAAEVSLSAASRSRMRELLASGNQRAKLIDRMLSDPARFLSTLLILKSLAYIAASAMAVCVAMLMQWSNVGVSASVGLVWLLLLAVQVISRGWALRQPETVALAIARVVDFVAAILAPLSLLLRRLAAYARGDADEVTPESVFLSEDGLRFLIHVGEGEGVIEEDEKQMIAGIFEFGETTVREIMVPRLDMVAVEVNSPLSEALDLIIGNGHSRIPVYEDSIDHLLGVLYAKDLLLCLRDGSQDISIRQLLRQAYFVPQSKKLDELFRGHAGPPHPYGPGCGRIRRYSRPGYDRRPAGRNRWRNPGRVRFGRAPIEKNWRPKSTSSTPDTTLMKCPGLSTSNLAAGPENIDTLGGFIYSQLGRVPEQGESIQFHDWRFTVLSVDSRRIEQVRVEPLHSAENGAHTLSQPDVEEQTEDSDRLPVTFSRPP